MIAGAIALAGILCVNGADDAQAKLGPPEVESVADADACFGPITSGLWVGTLPGAVNLQLHWMEVGYTNYDNEQFRYKFAGRGEFAGVLALPSRTVKLFGKRRSATQVQLVDVDLLIDPDHVRQDQWPDLVAHIKNVNLQGGMGTEDQGILVLKSDDGRRTEVCLTAKHAAGLGLDKLAPITVTDRPPSEMSWWVGQLNAGSQSFTRLALLRVANGAEDATVAILSDRNPERKFAGPVADGCPWATRGKFLNTLRALADEKIDWYGGEYGEDAIRIIERDTGTRLTKEEFRQAVLDTFGTLDRALLDCCPFPEVRHTTLFQAHSIDGEHLIGAVWMEQFNRRMRRLIGRAYKVAGLVEGAEKMDLRIQLSYVPNEGNAFELNHFDGFMTSLRQLPR